MNPLKRALAVALLAVLPTAALAQAFPSKPVRLIVPFAPGGTTDIVGRAIAQKLPDALGQPVIVENRPGAGTIIGTSALAQAPADGHTILLATPDFTINPSLHANLPFDPLKDFAPIARIATYPLVLVANAALPANSVRELVALAKSKPGSINFASGGNGSAPHLSGELFKSLAGVEMVHVPYKGNGPAITDLVAGQVQLLFTGMPPVETHLKSGKLKPLAVTGTRRLSSAPQLPTVQEEGVADFEVTAWYGFFAPAGTPPDVISKLNKAIGEAMRSPEVKERLISLGAELETSTPEDYGQMIRLEIAKWRKVVKEAGVKIN